MGCTHYWIIDSHNKGVCKNCGEAKQFPFYYERRQGREEGNMVTVNSRGETPAEGKVEATVEPPKGPSGRLSPKLRKELLEIGPEAFGEKYGYRSLIMLKGVYRKLKGREAHDRAVVTEGSKPEAREGKQARLKMMKRGGADSLHPCVKGLLMCMPEAGTPMGRDAKEVLKMHFNTLVELLYPDGAVV